MGNKENLNCIPLSILEDRATPTANEIELLIEWSEKFRTAFAGIDEEIKNSIKDAEEDSIKTLKELLNEKTYERAIELNKIATQIVTRYYDSFNGDYDAILELTKSKVESTLNEAYIAFKVYSNCDEAKHKSKDELFEEVQTILGEFNPQSADIEPILTVDAAKAGVRANLQDAINYLIDKSSEHATQLIQYIDEVIASSPLVYRKGEEPTQAPCTYKQEKGKDSKKRARAERVALPKLGDSYAFLNDNASWAITKADLLQTKIDEQKGITSRYTTIPQPKGAFTHIALTYDNDDFINMPDCITAFDRSITNAITELYRAFCNQHQSGHLFTTVNEIYRCMIGETANAAVHPSKQMTELIHERVSVMLRTGFNLDFRSEADKGLIKGDIIYNECIIKGRFIEGREINFISTNGMETCGFEIFTEPALSTYNRLKNQLHFVNQKLLNVKVDKNELTIVFRDYLIRQIEWILSKTSPRKSNRITLKSIYADTGILEPEARINISDTQITKRPKESEEEFNRRKEEELKLSLESPEEYEKIMQERAQKRRKVKIAQEKKKDLNKIYGILDSWVNVGYIKGYEPIKKSNTVVAIDIFTNKKRQRKSKNL